MASTQLPADPLVVQTTIVRDDIKNNAAVEIEQLATPTTPPTENKEILSLPATTETAIDIDSLVSQLTLDEKISLLSGRDWWTTAPIPRLTIPSLKFSDGPNGARGVSFVDGVTSACFPAAISLAATFDRSSSREVGRALAGETRSKGASVLLAPTVCMQRDPRGGRNFEAFSEDPFLTGELAASYIGGLQGEGIGASLKHYAVNEQETFRFAMDIVADERTMREVYLRPFEMAVKKSNPWTVMTSFSHVNGTAASAHRHLIQDVLRDQWGFEGMVLSDWAGTYSTVPTIEAGLDLEMPGPGIRRSLEEVKKALNKGEITEQMLDRSAKAVINLLQKSGKFESPDIPDEIAVDMPETRQLIRKTAADGMVLLKNASNILPIRPSENKVKSIALIGLAKSYLGHGGGSAQVNSHYKVTPWDGMQQALQGKDIQLSYAEGVRPFRILPLLTENVVDEEGNPGFTQRITTPATALDAPLTSNIRTPRVLSAEGHRDCITATITGYFTPTVSGNHYLSLCTSGNTTVWVDDDIIFQVQGAAADPLAIIFNVAAEVKAQYSFNAGQTYRIRMQADQVLDTVSGLDLFAAGIVGAFLGFMHEQVHDAQLLEEAAAAAKKADVSIVFVGHYPDWETEGSDRKTMALPRDGSQDKLISVVAEANPNTIVVNSTGSPITMPWLEDVAAVLQAWLPGQEAGHAMADILLGAVSPGGKLPCTFPRALELTPTYHNFPGDIENRRVEYKEGVFVGYRYYDEHSEAVLFPFGYGLTYSTFALSAARLSADKLSGDGTTTLTFEIINTGAVSASEVIQIYIGAVNPSLSRPKKELADFHKTSVLSPGNSEIVDITIDVHTAAYWNESKGLWSVDAGQYKIYIASSSVDILQELDLQIEHSFDISIQDRR